MNNYVPKVGDKVKATLGENVLVGLIHAKSHQNAWWQLVADGAEDVDPFLLSAADGWQFEQVVSVPTKFGAVIRRADGVEFSRNDTGDSIPWWTRGKDAWVSDAEATAGGFTVLFEGVDE